MLRRFCVFTNTEGLPCAIKASEITSVYVDSDGDICIITTETDSEGCNDCYYIKGEFAAIVKEIENCLA